MSRPETDLHLLRAGTNILPPAEECVIRKVLLSASVGLFFVAACTGGGSNATPPPPTANPELAMREGIEPWKSMNLPIDGAVVETSSSQANTVRFVAISPENLASPHAAIRQSLVEQGWAAEDDNVGATRETFFTRDGAQMPLTTAVRDGRPVGQIARF